MTSDERETEEPEVTTWADGFGVWHATVTTKTTITVGDAQRLARQAILDELRQRGTVDPDAVSIAWTSKTSIVRYEFAEVAD